MHDTSARLVERVLPAPSYRQWVLTVPSPLRLRIARDPGELRRVLNLFHRALRAELRRRARRLGLPVGEPAAVTFVQRFGGALNLHYFPDAPLTRGQVAVLLAKALELPRFGGRH
jgi:hypothetical protein